MDKYKGSVLAQTRKQMIRPRWANKFRNKVDYPSVVDMVAMVNYILKKKGLSEQLRVRQYHHWEQNDYPKWFRIAMVWMADEIADVCRNARSYKLLKTGDYANTPIIVPTVTIDERVARMNIE